MSGRRLAPGVGSRLNRDRSLSFTFNGRALRGFEGDTLASALLAGGTQLVGRSFKLHRPRGIYSCGVEEPNAIVDVTDGTGRSPNVRASLLELYDGLAAASVNCWPTVRFDVGSLNGAFAALLLAGFYYKTFKWPGWRLFEPAIRRMAGLGRVAIGPERERYEETNVAVDVLVVGGGVAGMSAAIAAAQAGARVLILCNAPRLGGSLGWRADAACESLCGQVSRLGIEVLTHTVAFGLYDHNLVAARQDLSVQRSGWPAADRPLRERLWKIRAASIVAATGALERPMVFPDNDRPGVMLAGAAEKYAHAYGVACGDNVVIAANGDHAYRVARSLLELGIQVAAVVDARPESMVDREAVAGFPAERVCFHSVIREVKGRRAVGGCTVEELGSTRGRPKRIECDLILSAGGFAPAVHLHSQAGGKLRWLDDASMFVPHAPLPGMVSVGACAGVFTRDIAVEHAALVGAAAARGAPVPATPIGGAGHSLANTHVRRVGRRQFIDLQNDVTASDIELAARENYRSVEHLKRYTTTGMGTDQGKTSNINALVLMAACTQRTPAEVGTTKFRPPFTPIPMGLFAGRRAGLLYRPLKHLAAENWHESHGAAFEEYGGWRRPAAYPRAGETVASAAAREATTARQRAGIFDGSPLGKLEVCGPDAAAFLDLMYLGTMSTLSVGQARYGVLLSETGIVADDGIVARLGPHRYWITTSSAGAERTTAAFDEWLQCEYTNLRVLVTSVTSRWANATIAGPRAWDWLASTGFSPDLAPPRMAHMSIRDSEFDAMPVRVLRASFSGELGYEIYFPADHADTVYERLQRSGAGIGATAYGVEALQIMRVEKGYIHIGTDTDGTTFPGDIGLARAVEKKAANFVGRRSLSRPVATDPDRLQLVGLVPIDRRSALPVGAHIASSAPLARAEGYVTSSVTSPTLGHPVALAMLARGRARIGARVRIHHLRTEIDAEVVTTPFVDPTGSRIDGT